MRIWLEVSHHAAFRIGGWAFVRADGGTVSGHAGGARQLDLERAALTGLIAALREMKGPAELRTSSPDVMAVPGRIKGEDPPAENLDLWAQAAKALAAGQVKILGVTASPGSPTAFTAGWAEFARDRAKQRGPFSAPIPKPNLVKAGA